MSRVTADPWVIDEAAYPIGGPVADQLRFLVQYAILAPSAHNAQPWRFVIEGDTLELRSDPERSLHVADPDDREMIASCGAALFHLRLAMRHFGYEPRIDRFPDTADACLLARVRQGPPAAETPDDCRLFNAILLRRTNRKPFDERPVSRATLDALQQSADREGVWLEIIDGEDGRDAVIGMIVEGDCRQWSDRAFRRELASWIHPLSHGDGLPYYRGGVGPVVARAFDLGRGVAKTDRRLARSAPVLALLGTDGDGPADWLAFGEALARILLRARVDGISASFLNQPVQIRELRRRLSDVVAHRGFPQLLLRFGYGPAVSASARRPLADVLIASP